jgi:hypothetical protein
VAAVVLQVGRKGLQDRHLLLVFRLGLLLVVDEPHQGGGEDIGGERRVDSAEAKPGQPRPTLQVLLRQETLQLRLFISGVLSLFRILKLLLVIRRICLPRQAMTSRKKNRK